MRAYLEAKSRARYMAPPPEAEPPTVLAALGPRMIELADELADGVLTYNVTPEHTADARGRLGAGKMLCVEQKVVLETDPVKARATARATVGIYLGLPNYRNNWLRLGFTEADMADGGSDRLIDAMAVWGNEAVIRERIQAHWDAGADHVCIQPLSTKGFGHADAPTLERVAPE
jgi:probable F420-dependent oxidoreductase